MTYTVGIVGSRDRRDDQTLSVIAAVVATLPAGSEILSGGAVGVDQMAAAAARAHGLQVRELKPDYSGARTRFQTAEACYARNRKLAEASSVLIAFPKADRKGGTENTIRHAKRAKVPVFVVLPGEVWPVQELPRKIRRGPADGTALAFKASGNPG